MSWKYYVPLVGMNLAGQELIFREDERLFEKVRKYQLVATPLIGVVVAALVLQLS